MSVAGNEEYDEDNWKVIHLKHATTGQECHFDVACRTVRSVQHPPFHFRQLGSNKESRCKLPNVDPDTGIRHKAEPDRALRKFRDVDEGAPKMGCMGMQMCPMFPGAAKPEQFQSFIEVGMDIDVVQRGHHVYICQ